VGYRSKRGGGSADQFHLRPLGVVAEPTVRPGRAAALQGSGFPNELLQMLPYAVTMPPSLA
jgi:hypothetical protein